MTSTFSALSVRQIQRCAQMQLHICLIASTSWIKSMFKISNSGLRMEQTIQVKTILQIVKIVSLNHLQRFTRALVITSACCSNINSSSQLSITPMFLTGVRHSCIAWRSVLRRWLLLILATTHQEQISNSLLLDCSVQSDLEHSTLTHASMQMMT